MTGLHVAVALSALLPILAPALPGAVDWERRVVRCTGTGAPNLREAAGVVAVTRAGTERAARRDAASRCLAALEGVHIRSGRTVAQALAGDPSLSAALRSVMRRFRPPGAPRFFSDGGVELDLVVPLDGELSRLLAPQPPPRAKVVGADGAAASAAAAGVIVDARGLGVAPALAPRLLDGEGREVHGPGALTSRGRESGAAAYAPDLATARKALAARVGAAPRVVKALRGQGVDVVLSDADAEALRGSAGLAEGRVVIVTERVGDGEKGAK